MIRQSVVVQALIALTASAAGLIIGHGTIASQPSRIRQTVEPPLAPADYRPPQPPEPRRLLPQRLPILDASPDAPPAFSSPEVVPAGGPTPALDPTLPLIQPTAGSVTAYEAPPPPVVSLLIRGPADSALGQDVTYRIVVQNRVAAVARNVVVKVPVRAKASLVKSSPDAKVSDEFWSWDFGSLEGGVTKELSLTVRPGDGAASIDLVARVAFEYGQWVQTRLAPTTLSVKKTGPDTAVRDEAIAYRIEVLNPSKVAVREVKLTDAIPGDMEYAPDDKSRTEKTPDGLKRVWDLGTVRAGERRVVEVKVTPRREGKFLTASKVEGHGAADDARLTTRVEEARLSVQLTPPEKAMLVVGRPCRYAVRVANDGTVKLSGVKVRLSHPADVKVARAPAGGRYADDSSATWTIRELPPGTHQVLNFDLKTQTEGRKKVRVEVAGDRGLAQSADHEAIFEGVANVDWGAIDARASVQRGDFYEVAVEVVNRGTSKATGFRLSAELPAEVVFESSPDGKHSDGKIFFAPEGAQLPAGAKAKFVFRVRAEKAGQATISLVMQADQLPSGTVKHDVLTTIVPAAPPPPAEDRDKKGPPVPSAVKIG